MTTTKHMRVLVDCELELAPLAAAAQSVPRSQTKKAQQPDYITINKSNVFCMMPGGLTKLIRALTGLVFSPAGCHATLLTSVCSTESKLC